jgi:hypothetical protein
VFKGVRVLKAALAVTGKMVAMDFKAVPGPRGIEVVRVFKVL